MDERQMPSSIYESIIWGFANRPLTEGVGMQPGSPSGASTPSLE
jgi:hypothetical protein